MISETCETTFLKPKDLVDMGLYQNTGDIFRTIKMHGNVPPHVRLSKKISAFLLTDFKNGCANRHTEVKMTDNSHSEKPTRYIPITKWPEYHPYPSINGLRYLRFHQEEFGYSSAFIHLNKRILVDEAEFFRILRSQQIDTNKKPS